MRKRDVKSGESVGGAERAPAADLPDALSYLLRSMPAAASRASFAAGFGAGALGGALWGLGVAPDQGKWIVGVGLFLIAARVGQFIDARISKS